MGVRLEKLRKMINLGGGTRFVEVYRFISKVVDLPSLFPHRDVIHVQRLRRHVCYLLSLRCFVSFEMLRVHITDVVVVLLAVIQEKPAMTYFSRCFLSVFVLLGINNLLCQAQGSVGSLPLRLLKSRKSNGVEEALVSSRTTRVRYCPDMRLQDRNRLTFTRNWK